MPLAEDFNWGGLEDSDKREDSSINSSTLSSAEFNFICCNISKSEGDTRLISKIRNYNILGFK